MTALGRDFGNDGEDIDAYWFIRNYIDANGYPPSRREITEHMGKISYSEGQRVVRRLQAKGLIEVAPGVPRGMRITKRITRAKMIADSEAM